MSGIYRPGVPQDVDYAAQSGSVDTSEQRGSAVQVTRAYEVAAQRAKQNAGAAYDPGLPAAEQPEQPVSVEPGPPVKKSR